METTPRTKKRKSPAGPMELMLRRQIAEDPAIAATVREYVEDTARDLGGWDHLTAGQRAMLLCQKLTLAILLAGGKELVDSGALTGDDGRPSQMLRILDQYGTTFRQGQVALGLARARVQPGSRTQTLEEIRREYADSKRQL